MHEIDSYFHSLLSPNMAQLAYQWHKERNFVYVLPTRFVGEELKLHPLFEEKKLALLTDVEFLLTSPIRQASKDITPLDWEDKTALDELWIKPTEGHLAKIWKTSDKDEDKEKLLAFQNSPSYIYRGLGKTTSERLQARIEKLQEAIARQRVTIFLGRQTAIYKRLLHALNEQYAGEMQFISDHSWTAMGFTEPGMKTSDNRLSLIQACETVRRLPTLFPQESIAHKSRILFSLDGYDMRHALAAMYSDCNRIARAHTKPNIPPLTHFEFAYTGLTDLELANIVRNRAWFELTSFCRTGKDGTLEELSAAQVVGEYGIICLDR
jgi:hypothetical protein